MANEQFQREAVPSSLPFEETVISPLMVFLECPEITGDTVTFRWSQSEPNPFQRANTFSIRYEGLDLSRFRQDLFVEVFLGLQLKVFAAYARPVELIAPDPVVRSTWQFWKTFHRAELVTLSPLSDIDSYEPWRNQPSLTPGTKNAIFFGGGRDSIAMTSILAELDGPNQVMLFQAIAPLNPDPKLEATLEARQEAVMLRPVREQLGVSTQRFWTDYQAIFLRTAETQRPHLELYTVGALPAMLARGIELATFCIEWNGYAFSFDAIGNRRFHYAASRPEVLAMQSRHYRRVLGAHLDVTDLNMLLTSLTAMKIVIERYPEALPLIVMCTLAEVDQRWCYHCAKCMWYGIYSLALGLVDPAFDYDFVFGTSRYVLRLVEFAESGAELGPSGNARLPAFTHLTRGGQFCHAVATINLDLIADKISSHALANLITIQAMFGNRTCPAYGMAPARVLDLLDNETANRVARIIAEHVPLVDELPGPFLDEGYIYDFSVRMPTPLTALSHLRD